MLQRKFIDNCIKERFRLLTEIRFRNWQRQKTKWTTSAGSFRLLTEIRFRNVMLSISWRLSRFVSVSLRRFDFEIRVLEESIRECEDRVSVSLRRFDFEILKDWEKRPRTWRGFRLLTEIRFRNCVNWPIKYRTWSWFPSPYGDSISKSSTKLSDGVTIVSEVSVSLRRFDFEMRKP